MTEDNQAQNKAQPSLMNRLSTNIIVQQSDGEANELSASQLIRGAWQSKALAEIPPLNMFSRLIVLIPNNKTAFRNQRFSTDLVTEKDLQEAISLNIASWSPYGENTQHFSIHEKKQGDWWVAIWTWSNETQQQMLKALPQPHTHIMPELAWQCGRQTAPASSLLINNSSKITAYIYLKNGLPINIAWPENEQETKRFWRSLGVATQNINQLTLTNSTTAKMAGLPQALPQITLTKIMPKSNWLSQAQTQGGSALLNPQYWTKAITALALLLAIWAISDALAIQHKSQKIAQLIAQATQNNQNLITQQDTINSSYPRLARFAQLKQQQQQAEFLLAELSTRIPNDIWLEVVQLDNRWLDIRGKGKDVIRLLALLENIKGIQDIVLLNDVRPDARTGDEQFQIRLILTEQALPEAQQ